MSCFLESRCVCDLSCLKIATSHEQLLHNAIASQAAFTTLLTPLAAVNLKETINSPNSIDKNTSVKKQ